MADQITAVVRETSIGADTKEALWLMNREVVPALRQIIAVHNAANGPIKNISASETVTGEHTVFLANTTDDNVTVTLPPADQWKAPLTLVKVDGSVNSAIFAAATGETINGLSTFTITLEFGRVTIVSDEAGAWYVIAV